MTNEDAPADGRFELRGGGAVELVASGFVHPQRGGRGFTPYLELHHVALSPRGLRLGAERGCVWLPHDAFAAPGAARALADALRARVAALPDGAARLERDAALERRQAEPGRGRIGLGLALVCAALFVAQQLSPTLLLDGEYYDGGAELLWEPWRFVTAQLLHVSLPHLAFNGLVLIALGGVLERQLGRVRTILVLGASAVGAMLGCVAADYTHVVGVSGVCYGIIGGLLALELRRPDLLPAGLRLPRRLLVTLIIAEAVVLSFVPNVAHGAHLGGGLGGAIAALGLAPGDVRAFRASPRLRFAAGAVLGVSLAALTAFAASQLDPAAGAARRGARLLEIRGIAPELLNNDAWVIAISPSPSEEQLALALRLARRAVRATRGLDPNVLDTLAEVYFRLDRVDDALDAIEQAIALAPDEPYFAEQRRRFLGERAPDDRPEAPEELPAPELRPFEEAPEEEPEEVPSLRV